MYGDQPVAWPVIGSKENVLGFTRKDFVTYQKEHYTASNTVIVVAGSFDPVVVQQAVKKTFAALSKEKPKTAKKVSDKQTEPKSGVFKKATDQMHIALSFRSIPFNHPDGAAVSLLSTILGGGMSSRLFLHLREELGAAYYVRSEQDPFLDHGMFTVTAGIDKNRYREITESIVAILKEIKDTLVPAEELHKVKEYTLGMMRLGLESSDSIAGFYGTQILLKDEYKTPEQLTKEYMKVTAADIQRVARKLFVAKHANIAVVGPVEKGSVDTELLKKL
jgi:predicted Zn-dependent peptidase